MNSLNFLKTLVRTGEFKNRVFLAGGAVRDMVMGNEPKDLDVVVTGSLTSGMDFAVWATKKMGNFKEGSNPVVFPLYGTAKFNLLDGTEIESVATRKEKYSNDSRKPAVSQGELVDDVLRRDFCCNSLLLNLTTDEVLDLTGKGKTDIKNGVIRTTSDPDIIFAEDPLRMLRAIRFACKYGWDIESQASVSIAKNASKIRNISFERIRDELNKMLVTDSPDLAIDSLVKSGLMKFIIPELVETVNVGQNEFHKEDVFEHTLSVVLKTQPVLIQRLTALFHDIGKPTTKTNDETGIHFYNHEDIGAKISENVMKRLKYSNEEVAAVCLGVKNHMRLKQAGNYAENLSDKALRKFVLTMGDGLDDLLEVMHADNLSHAEGKTLPNQIPSIKERIKNLNFPSKKPVLPVNGEDLIALGLKPGPIFKSLLSIVEESWLENPGLTKEDGIGIIKAQLKLTK
jgi:poly(A) polymerase